MADLNRKKIISSSKDKILRREHDNLKKDYTKLGALNYKSFYESESMSFILDNSRYIFSEPYKGKEFYKSFIESNIIPIHRIGDELNKINEFIESYADDMREEQYNEYVELQNVIESIYSNKEKSIALQKVLYENTDEIDVLYDVIYEYKTNSKFDELSNEFLAVFNECNSKVNIIDFLNIVFEHKELQNNIYPYLNDIYHENGDTIELCKSNIAVNFIIENTLQDKYFEDGFKSLTNMNAKDIIYNIAESTNINFLTNNSIDYLESENLLSINGTIDMIYESVSDDNVFEEIYAEDKYQRLMVEKEIIDFAINLISHTYLENGDIVLPSHIVEYVKSVTFGDNTDMELLQEFSENIGNELDYMMEKYFSNTGAPGSVIASSLGYEKNTDVDDDFIKSKEKIKEEDEDELDHKSSKKKSFTEAVDDEDDKSSGHKYVGIKKPKKKSLAKRIANKALDTDVQYKKKVAEGKRNAVDIKNAVKAIGKIPANIVNAIKKQLSDWDEMDDNRRKRYILQPGFRKKYYRAMRLCLMHGVAFAVNPIINIIIGFGSYLSKEKDIRIKNEFIRELSAEIKIINEKIEDAKSKGDDKKKYQMMRYKEKLEAEHTRVMANSKYV